MTELGEFDRDITNAVKRIVTVAKSIEDALTTDSARLKSLRTQITQHEQAEKTAHTARETAKVEYTKEKYELDERIDVYRKEKHQLETEVETLVNRKGDLKLDNSKLEQKNKEYREYETNAWKVLDAKDKELLERENALQQRESLRTPVRTLLPPTDVVE